jgi:ParB/RepB/Spo0J family partition protein
MGRVQSNRISPEAQRLAQTGVSSWLAGRIEGLPPRAAPAAPVPAAAASLASIGAGPAPSKPQLDLFSKGPDPAAASTTPAVAAPAAAVSVPPPETLPLALPTKPVVMLPVAALRPGRFRARRSGGDDGIPALAASVAAHGVREPILVRRAAHDPPAYEVVAGERRRLAAERAGRAEVPAVVVSVNDTEALMLSLTENLGRRDFSPLDEARAYLKLLTDYRINPGAMALRLARERTHIAMTLRLLGLPERVRHYIDSGQIRPTQAYELLKAPDPEALAEQMVRGAAAPALGPS